MSSITQPARRVRILSAGLPARSAFVERLLPAMTLGAVVAACWGYLGYVDWAMRNMDVSGMAMPSAGPWAPADFALVAAMWLAMMVAMMIPAALPALRAHRQVLHTRSPFERGSAPSTLFLGGYVSMWATFSVAMTMLQWRLHEALVVTPAMTVRPALGAALLVAAGLYQWTPLKDACLKGCSAPVVFLVQNWRSGRAGAFWMGVTHGAHCVGCCWLLMTLMFVYGGMNLTWIVAITAIVLAEKAISPSRWYTRAIGVGLIAWGFATALL